MEQQLSRLDQEKVIHEAKLAKNKEMRRFKTVITGICRERGVATAKYQLEYLRENPSAMTITSNGQSFTSTTLPHNEACDLMEAAINEYIRIKIEEKHPDVNSRNQKRIN